MAGDGYEDTFVLASNGRLYSGIEDWPEGVPGTVRITPIRTKHEAKLFGSRGKSYESSMDMIFRNCIAEPNLRPEDITLQDRLHLLIRIRALSYGSDYTIGSGSSIPCSMCGNSIEKVIDLTKLRVNYLEKDEPFEMILPRSGHVVQWRDLRGSDLHAIRNFVQNARQNRLPDEGDPEFIFRMAKFVVGVDGKELNIGEAREFIGNLIGEDSAYFLEAVEAEYGVELNLNLTCDVCGSVLEGYGLPINQEFFRPRRLAREVPPRDNEE